jgi:hypothetical protein
MSEAIIDRDLPCRGCGYNLRGLSPEGRCPECATRVSVSLQPTDLSLGDPRQFHLTILGSYLTLALCFWEIVSKAGWIFISIRQHVSARSLLQLFCFAPLTMALICFLQVLALYAFTALSRSRVRGVLLVLGILLVVMEIPFCIGHRWDRFVNLMAESILAIMFFRLCLSHAAQVASSIGDQWLVKQFEILKWAIPSALAIHFLALIAKDQPVPMIFGDGAMIVLVAWMILPLLHLRAILQRMTPLEAASHAHLLVRPSSAALSQHDHHWLVRVQTGLLLQALWFGMFMVLPVLSFVNSRLGASQYVESQYPVPGRYVHIVSAFLILTVLAQVVFVWWLTAAPAKPDPSGEPSGMSVRQWLRFFSILSLLAYLVLSGPVAWLTFSCLCFTLFLFIEKDLAVRADDPDMRQQAAILKWFLPLASQSWNLMEIVSDFWFGHRPVMGLNHFTHMLALLAGLWAVWILYRLSRRFADAAEAAQRR